MRAIQITEFGGPEVLTLTELPDPAPGPGQLLIEVRHAGVNYADTHQSENSYLAPSRLPMVPGVEVVGRTADGRRVVALVTGGYAEKAIAVPAMAFDVPDEVDDATALALLVQGTTAWVLLHRTVHLAPGESVVVHAAAGGVGSLAVQLAKIAGAGRVIATASTEEKRQLALDLGADVAVDAAEPDLTEALRGGERRAPGRRRAGDDRRAGDRPESRRARAVRPARLLRHGEPASAQAGRLRIAAQPFGDGGRHVVAARFRAARQRRG